MLLDHTDTLIICCSSTDVSLVAAADALAGVRGQGVHTWRIRRSSW